jgi:hypothetical protein
MGSPLGPTLAEYYMCHLENAVLSNENLKPEIYCRYVDDIFLIIEDSEKLISLKNSLELNSVLKFTYELGTNNALPFLDILVKSDANCFQTTVFRQLSDGGKIMNGKSECPERYNQSVLRAFISRAFKTCTNENDLSVELNNCKQLLVNNGYSNKAIDREITYHRTSRLASHSYVENNENLQRIFYRNQMSEAYKIDERVIREMINRNVTLCNHSELKLCIYYKNSKIKNLIMSNNLAKKTAVLQQSNVIYKYSCKQEDCELLPNMY